MSKSVNKVILVGRLGADPEVRNTKDGKAIMNFRLATSERWKDREGNYQEKTEWTPVTIMNERTIEYLDGRLVKGSLTYVEGKMQTRKWQDKDGNDRYTTEVLVGAYNGEVNLLESADRDSDGEGQQRATSSRSTPSRSTPSRSARSPSREPRRGDLDDEIPF